MYGCAPAALGFMCGSIDDGGMNHATVSESV
jgi:hypothetical protein